MMRKKEEQLRSFLQESYILTFPNNCVLQYLEKYFGKYVLLYHGRLRIILFKIIAPTTIICNLERYFEKYSFVSSWKITDYVYSNLRVRITLVY